jgi:WD40 repeat protein
MYHICSFLSLFVCSKASGDELGNLKIVNIFPFKSDATGDSSHGRGNDAMKTITGPKFTDKLRLSLNAHDSTIYSVHWLPQTFGTKKTRHFTIATGSNDKVVRLWKIEVGWNSVFVFSNSFFPITFSFVVVFTHHTPLLVFFSTTKSLRRTTYPYPLCFYFRRYPPACSALTAGKLLPEPKK